MMQHQMIRSHLGDMSSLCETPSVPSSHTRCPMLHPLVPERVPLVCDSVRKG